MGKIIYRLLLGGALILGGLLVLVGLVDLPHLIGRYFSYGGVLTYNPETIARFNRTAPLLGIVLLGASLAVHRFRDALARLIRECDVPKDACAHRPLWHLFLISVAGLFLEIVLIRWISVEVRIFAYFKNLALLACFFGFGLGAGLHRRRVSYLLLLVPLFVLTALVQFDAFLGPLSLRRISVLIAPQSDLLYWGAFAKNSILHGIGFSLAAVTFLLVVLPFIPIGQLVARLLASDQHQPITAYSVNIVGSLLGLWLYSVISFLWLPPVVWFGLPLLMTLYLLRQRRRAFMIAGGGGGAHDGDSAVSQPARTRLLVSLSKIGADRTGGAAGVVLPHRCQQYLLPSHREC